METLGRLSIITNAFIIALTSEFIPKLVYRSFYSQDGSLHGYVNFSLSYFDMKDLDPESKWVLNFIMFEPLNFIFSDFIFDSKYFGMESRFEYS